LNTLELKAVFCPCISSRTSRSGRSTICLPNRCTIPASIKRLCARTSTGSRAKWLNKIGGKNFLGKKKKEKQKKNQCPSLSAEIGIFILHFPKSLFSICSSDPPDAVKVKAKLPPKILMPVFCTDAIVSPLLTGCCCWLLLIKLISPLPTNTPL